MAQYETKNSRKKNYLKIQRGIKRTAHTNSTKHQNELKAQNEIYSVLCVEHIYIFVFRNMNEKNQKKIRKIVLVFFRFYQMVCLCTCIHM